MPPYWMSNLDDDDDSALELPRLNPYLPRRPARPDPGGWAATVYPLLLGAALLLGGYAALRVLRALALVGTAGGQ